MKPGVLSLVNFIFAAVLFSGCASKYQAVSLTYDLAANAKGASGDLLIAQPVEQFGATRLPDGYMVIGAVKNKDVSVATKDSVGDWIMLALMQEFYSAGYNVKTVKELPADVAKGIKVTVTKLSANQIPEELIVKDEAEIGVAVEVWKDGKQAKTFNFENKNEGKGLRRTAGLISAMLGRTLQDLMKQIVPNVMKELAAEKAPIAEKPQ